MEAYLSKRGNKVKNWKKRYFVLMDGVCSSHLFQCAFSHFHLQTLLYYRLKIDSSPAGSISCRGAQLSVGANAFLCAANDHVCFCS